MGSGGSLLDRMRPVDIILKLENNPTPDQVEELIRRAWEEDCDEFFIGLDLATNSAYDYRLSAVPEIQDEDDGDIGTLTFAHFHKVALNIASGELPTNQVRLLLEDCALTANITEWNVWYRRILLKTLALHLPITNIRQVLISLTTGSPVLPNTNQ